jgi:phosphatidylserine/phosphatidylglycerophosphate/cardiolipin synthase-like enzyme
MVIDASSLALAAPAAEEHLPLVAAQVESFALDPAHVRVELAAVERTLLDQFGNIHVKTVVVDGRVVVITGANPEAQHDFETPWHDAGFVLWGHEPAAAALADFDTSWGQARIWTCGAEPGELEDCTTEASPFEHAVLEEATPPDALDACLALAVTRRPAAFANEELDNPQGQAFLSAFDGAQATIRVETPNINDDDAKAALLRAALRGVHVQLITSHSFNELSEAPVGGTNGDNVASLRRDLALLGGAESDLEVRWYSRDGVHPVEGNGPWASHVKYASIDGRVVVFGTTNMDTASWNLSHELNWFVDDDAVTAAYDAQLFEPDWSRAIPVRD